MHDPERLSIVEACRALIHRYAYLNDERDFDALVELFTENAVYCRPTAPDSPLRGREAILNSFRARSPAIATFHLCSDVLIDVESPRRARARSRILLLMGARPADGGHPDPASMKPVLPGTFRDELQLTAAGWKFASRNGNLWLP